MNPIVTALKNRIERQIMDLPTFNYRRSRPQENTIFWGEPYNERSHEVPGEGRQGAPNYQGHPPKVSLVLIGTVCDSPGVGTYRYQGGARCERSSWLNTFGFGKTKERLINESIACSYV
jgi:hypothetical protein